MRQKLIGLFFLLAGGLMTALCLAMLFDVAGRQAALDSTQAAIRALLDAQVAAWNRGDLDAFMAGYLKSDEVTFYSDQGVQQGWEARLQRYRDIYQQAGQAMGTLAFDDLRIELVGEDTAIVRGRYVLAGPRLDRGVFTLLLRQTPDGWRIVHDHTSSQRSA